MMAELGRLVPAAVRRKSILDKSAGPSPNPKGRVYQEPTVSIRRVSAELPLRNEELARLLLQRERALNKSLTSRKHNKLVVQELHSRLNLLKEQLTQLREVASEKTEEERSQLLKDLKDFNQAHKVALEESVATIEQQNTTQDIVLAENISKIDARLKQLREQLVMRQSFPDPDELEDKPEDINKFLEKLEGIVWEMKGKEREEEKARIEIDQERDSIESLNNEIWKLGLEITQAEKASKVRDEVNENSNMKKTVSPASANENDIVQNQKESEDHIEVQKSPSPAQINQDDVVPNNNDNEEHKEVQNMHGSEEGIEDDIKAQYQKSYRSLIIHLSLRLEELTKDLLLKEMEIINRNKLLQRNQISQQDLEFQLALLNIQLKKLGQAVQEQSASGISEEDYQRQSSAYKSQIEEIKRAADSLDILESEENAELLDIKQKIKALDESILNFQAQLGMHINTPASGITLPEMDVAKNEQFFADLTERIDEIKQLMINRDNTLIEKVEEYNKGSQAIVVLEDNLRQARRFMNDIIDKLPYSIKRPQTAEEWFYQGETQPLEGLEGAEDREEPSHHSKHSHRKKPKSTGRHDDEREFSNEPMESEEIQKSNLLQRSELQQSSLIEAPEHGFKPQVPLLSTSVYPADEVNHQYQRMSRSLIIHLSMRLEELTKDLLLKEMEIINQTRLLKRSEANRRELEAHLDLLNLQTAKFSQVISGRAISSDQSEELHLEKATVIHGRITDARRYIQDLMRDSDEDTRLTEMRNKIDTFDKMINNFNEQLDSHKKISAGSSTAHEVNAQREEAYINNLSDKIDEMRELVKERSQVLQQQSPQVETELKSYEDLHQNLFSSLATLSYMFNQIPHQMSASFQTEDPSQKIEGSVILKTHPGTVYLEQVDQQGDSTINQSQANPSTQGTDTILPSTRATGISAVFTFEDRLVDEIKELQTEINRLKNELAIAERKNMEQIDHYENYIKDLKERSFGDSPRPDKQSRGSSGSTTPVKGKLEDRIRGRHRLTRT